MRQMLFVLLAVVSVFAINDVTIPYSSFADSGIIYASEHNANWDSIESHHNALIDTLDGRFIRFTDLTSGDSTLSILEVDTIAQLEILRGNPSIDSLTVTRILNVTGRIAVDSIQSLDVIRGNPNIDSAQLSVILAADVIRGNPNVDSLSGLNVLRGNPDIDSAQLAVMLAADVIRGNPDIDSISGSPKINAVTVLGTATVDSLASTKGIYCTQINTGVGLTEVPQVSASTFACSLFVNGEDTIAGTGKYYLNYYDGETRVDVYFPVTFYITSSGTAAPEIGGIPEVIQPNSTTYSPIVVMDNSNFRSGTVTMTTASNKWSLLKYDGSAWTSGNTKGVASLQFLRYLK